MEEHIVNALVFALVVFGVYLFPSIIAAARGLKNGTSIFFLNIFLGWTLLGWVVALCWASAGTAVKS